MVKKFKEVRLYINAEGECIQSSYGLNALEIELFIEGNDTVKIGNDYYKKKEDCAFGGPPPLRRIIYR